MSTNKHPSAVIFGCAGKSLSKEEKKFFTAVNPVGFILFARNIETPDQVKALIADLRACTDRPDAPVLVDQEGGRVARLKPPYWSVFPAQKAFGDWDGLDKDVARELCRKNFSAIGRELAESGFNVDCSPVLDVPVDGANPQVVGDRPFSFDPDVVAELGAVACESLMQEGVLPVIKHIPGHGRAKTDSHFDLPVVDMDFETLKETDFKPFKALAELSPWAMTAHLLYTAIDAKKPASLSEKVIETVIRGEIGFDGFLICDDLSMKALSGGFADLTKQAIAAGCDAVLHCNGDMKEMKKIASAVKPLTEKAWERYCRGQKILAGE